MRLNFSLFGRETISATTELSPFLGAGEVTT